MNRTPIQLGCLDGTCTLLAASAMVKTCHNCHGHSDEYKESESNLKRCAGCQKVYYCSIACQKENWVYHIFDCKPRRPINTADYLALAMYRNLLPEHPQTYVDYGFDRAFTAEEKSNLGGLYIGMSLTSLMRSFSMCIQVSSKL
jgi:hypothetical protein